MTSESDTEMKHDDHPVIDTSGEHPTAKKGHELAGRCYGSSTTGGECEPMGLSFDNIDEWKEHRRRHHPVNCDRCDVLSAYKRDNSPSSYCFRHIPDDPDVVYAWRRTNTESVVEPPKAPDDHPIEAALKGVDR